MNAVFTANGKEVVYTANTGFDLDEVEVRQITLGDENEIKVLYEEAFLQDVEWKDMYAFEYLYLYSSPYYGSSFCPGAQSVTLANPVSGTLEASETACYKIELAANQSVSISASSDSGAYLYLNLYDQDGYYLYSDDDSGPDYDPMIHYTTTTSGRYYVQVTTYASTGGSYTLTVTEWTGSASSYDAQPLYEYQTISDAITYDDEMYVEELGLYTYGDMYYFEGNAGDYVVISCSGYSYGSSMDPQMYLFDSNMYNLTSDDDSGESYDSQISYYLPNTGTYYLLVIDHYNYYGTESDYWYDLYLTK